MDRRSFLTALLASPAVLAVLQGCGSSVSSPPSTNATVTRSRATRFEVAETESTAAVGVVNDFGFDLYRALTSAGAPTSTQANLVVSPASIAIALAMTRVGAKGTTAAEIDQVLHIADAAALPRSMNALSTGLDSRTQRIEGTNGEPVDIVLSVVNSLWAQQGFSFEQPFLDVLAGEFGAAVQLVDYSGDPEAARQAINAWVDKATKDRIHELIGQGAITPLTRLTLVNAVYMKAPWYFPFTKSSTAPADFTTTGGKTVSVRMMHDVDRFGYVQRDGFQAIELPYQGDDLTMLVVMPDDGGSLGDAVAALAGIAGTTTSTKVSLSLPKFDIQSSIGLGSALQAMGMPTAFDAGAADFSLMTTEDKLFIGDVIHQADITVDEDGTEAAAATAVMMAGSGLAAPEQIVDLVVDRPFVFAIRDDPTGALLFVGHIGDPSQTR